MPKSVFASVFVCESVLWEPTGLASAIRIMEVVTVGVYPNSSDWHAHFFALTRLQTPIRGDASTHLITLVALGPSSEIVARTIPKSFVFGYAVDPKAPGGYLLSTEFNITSLKPPSPLGTYEIRVVVDDEIVAHTAVTLRKR